jgi:hypothetical protein
MSSIDVITVAISVAIEELEKQAASTGLPREAIGYISQAREKINNCIETGNITRITEATQLLLCAKEVLAREHPQDGTSKP